MQSKSLNYISRTLVERLWELAVVHHRDGENSSQRNRKVMRQTKCYMEEAWRNKTSGDSVIELNEERSPGLTMKSTRIGSVLCTTMFYSVTWQLKKDLHALTAGGQLNWGTPDQCAKHLWQRDDTTEDVPGT